MAEAQQYNRPVTIIGIGANQEIAPGVIGICIEK